MRPASIRVAWKPYSLYKSPCISSPLCWSPGDHEATRRPTTSRWKGTSTTPELESAETLRTTDSPKRRNETPNPKVKGVSHYLEDYEEGELCSSGLGEEW